jgi:hypothetical protein
MKVVLQENWAHPVGTLVKDIDGWDSAGYYAVNKAGAEVVSGGMVKGKTSDGTLAFVDATTNDCYVEGTLVFAATSSAITTGLAVRCIDHLNFISMRAYGSSNVQIYWHNNSASATQLEMTSHSHDPADVYRLEVEEDILRLYANDVKISSDIDITGKLSGSKVGFYTKVKDPAFGPLKIVSLSSDAITITPQKTRQAIPVFGALHTHTVAGDYVGTNEPTAIECRVEEYVSNATVKDWAVLDANPSIGTYSGTVDVPKGQYYRILTRYANNHSVVAESARIGFGHLFLGDGQSNMLGLLQGGDAVASDNVAIFDGADWNKPTSAHIVHTLNAISEANGCVVGFCSTAVSSSAISQHLSGGSNYDARVAMLTAIGGKASGMIWDQGEGDSSSLTYFDDLGTLDADILARSGQASNTLPLFIVQLGRNDGVTGNDAGWQRIRAAQTQYANANPNAHICSQKLDLPMADGLHFTPTGYKSTALRIADSINKVLLGTGDSGRGIIPTSAKIVGQTVEIPHDLNGNTGITLPVNAKDGYEVSEDDFSTLVGITSISTTDNKIILALDKAVTEVKVRSQQGQDPDHAKFPVGNKRYDGQTVMVEPIVISLISTDAVDSMLNLDITGIPDGTYTVTVLDDSRDAPTILKSFNAVYVSGSTEDITLTDIPADVQTYSLIRDTNEPSLTGDVLKGLTYAV